MMIATSAPRRSARRRLRTDSAFGNVVADLQRAVVKVARERGPIDWLRRLSPALVGGLLVGLACQHYQVCAGRFSYLVGMESLCAPREVMTILAPHHQIFIRCKYHAPRSCTFVSACLQRAQ